MPPGDPDLYDAIRRNQVDKVKQLIAAGAEVNATTPDGDPLLREAILWDRTEIAQILVDAGADVNAVDSDGDPLLRVTFFWDRIEIAQILVDAGADVNAVDSDGDPLLHFTIFFGFTEIAQILIDAGADVNAVDSDGDPLLHEAILWDRTEMVQILIAAGADAIPVDSNGDPLLRPYVKIVDRSSSSLTLSVEIGNATYYEIRRRAATAPVEWTELGRLDSRTLNDHGLDQDATYYYSAKGCNSVGCTGYSGEIGGVTESAGQVNVPSVPTGVRGRKVNLYARTDDARVTWSAAPGATYYEVYQGSRFDAEISAPQTGYNDGSPNSFFGAFEATSYKVRACNKAGCSAFSERVTVY